VSGQDEARFSGYGVMCGNARGVGVMGDLGGGSLELVALGHGQIGSSSTLPIGRSGSCRRQERSQARRDRRHRGGALAARGDRQDFLRSGRRLRSFARSTWSRRAIRYNHPPIRHSRRRGARGGAADRGAERKSLEKMPGVSRRRVDTLPLACLALDRLLAALKPRNVVFSAFGCARASTTRGWPESEQARHPLIAISRRTRGGLAPASI